MVEQKLATIFKTANAAAKEKGLKELIDGSEPADLEKIIQACVSDSTTKSDAKVALRHLAKERLGKLPNDACKSLCEKAADILKPKIMLLAAEDALFKRELANVLDAKGDLAGACQVLMTIQYDNDTLEEKIEDYLTLSEFQFELGDATAAEGYCNKVAHIINDSKNPESTKRYRMARVRLQDSKREFLHAAQGYYTLGINETDIDIANELLRLALTCTILSPAGPRKARQLGILHKEERLKSNQYYELLAKMFNGEIVKQADVQEFKGSLEPHQNVTGVDGYTVLDRALIEHNIVVISKIYMNITFKELGNFLGIRPEQAEETIAKMVAEKRIEAVLDQQNELVEFEEEGRQQQTYNAQIKVACENVDSLMQDILKAYPQLAKYNNYVF